MVVRTYNVLVLSSQNHFVFHLNKAFKTSNKTTNISYLFVSFIEVEHPLKASNKRTHIALPTYFIN